ncbi:TPA: hypothetical protein N5L24_004181 [Enterobacter roggenkampii]|nr:hypothetical protein [Enterobacter roggenkampii]
MDNNLVAQGSFASNAKPEKNISEKKPTTINDPANENIIAYCYNGNIVGMVSKINGS